jgi:hypothetical protein
LPTIARLVSDRVMDRDDRYCGGFCAVVRHADDGMFRSFEALSMLLASHSKGGSLDFGLCCVSSGHYLVDRLGVGAAGHLAVNSRLRREMGTCRGDSLRPVFDFVLPLVESMALLVPDVKALLKAIEGFLDGEFPLEAEGESLAPKSLLVQQSLQDDELPTERERVLLRQCRSLCEVFSNGVVILDALRSEDLGDSRPGYPVLQSLLSEPVLSWRSVSCDCPSEEDFRPVFGGTTGVPCLVQFSLLRKTWCFSEFLGAFSL